MTFTMLPVKGKNFIDRKKITTEIINTLTDKQVFMGFALYGIRRVGKSSIFIEIQRRLERNDFVVPIYLNVWDLTEETVPEFAKVLRNAIINAYGPKLGLKYKAEELLRFPIKLLGDTMKSLRVNVTLGEDIEAILKWDEQEKIDYNYLIDEVFDLAENLAKETDTRCALLIDEFPALIELKLNGKKVGEPIIKKIRTIQERKEHVIISISGSVRKTMDMVAVSSGSAFYKQLILREIKPLKPRYTRKLINENLGGEATDDAYEQIHKLSNGIPFYIQAIGKKLRELRKDTINLKDVDSAFNTFLGEEGTLIFRQQFKQLSPKERLIVKTMAKNEVYVLSEIAKAMGENPTNISWFLNDLEDKGVLIKEDPGRYMFMDPIFKKWLHQKFED
ncbi:MAG: ATP-binding protein [Candidatus Altiarchaeales archaeon]|nr:ATP-binding protein [Candidatus Altiarchaeales archaeon]